MNTFIIQEKWETQNSYYQWLSEKGERGLMIVEVSIYNSIFYKKIYIYIFILFELQYLTFSINVFAFLVHLPLYVCQFYYLFLFFIFEGSQKLVALGLAVSLKVPGYYFFYILVTNIMLFLLVSLFLRRYKLSCFVYIYFIHSTVELIFLQL